MYVTRLCVYSVYCVLRLSRKAHDAMTLNESRTSYLVVLYLVVRISYLVVREASFVRILARYASRPVPYGLCHQL